MSHYTNDTPVWDSKSVLHKQSPVKRVPTPLCHAVQIINGN